MKLEVNLSFLLLYSYGIKEKEALKFNFELIFNFTINLAIYFLILVVSLTFINF